MTPEEIIIGVLRQLDGLADDETVADRIVAALKSQNFSVVGGGAKVPRPTAPEPLLEIMSGYTCSCPCHVPGMSIMHVVACCNPTSERWS